MEASEERIKVEAEGGVAEARLVRGAKHNGLDAAMFDALLATAGALASDRGLRAVVLSGEGPSFCAGLDFKAIAGGTGLSFETAFEREDGEIANYAQRAAYDWRRIPVPVIAALHGNCLGGGAQIALAADIRIAAPDTRIAIAEVGYGLIPDMSLTQTLPDLVGIDVAKELVWTGRVVGAEEALALGLVTRVADDPRGAALALAHEIAARSPDAIRAGKRLLDATFRTDARSGLALEAELQQQLMRVPNTGAAMQARLSGEPPQFADPAV